jgi:hypothetical protein
MLKTLSNLAVAVGLGTLMVAGVSGCSLFSNPIPVDCNVVKTQQQAGKTNAQIASDLGAKESEVAACQGPETSGNKASGSIIPQSY